MTTAEILDGFKKLKALVVGDICLDRWCTYDPATSEPSRETGIPRLGVVSTEVTPGGGGTVANNLAALGAGKVAVLGIRGDDGFGFELVRALNERGITANLMVEIRRWQTFTYTKLLNSQTGIEDQPRVDFISTKPLPPEAEKRVIDNLVSAIEGFDVVLVADQAETAAGGVVTPAVRRIDYRACGKYAEQGVSGGFSKTSAPVPGSDGQAESHGGGSGLPATFRACRFQAAARTSWSPGGDGDARAPGRPGGRRRQGDLGQGTAPLRNRWTFVAPGTALLPARRSPWR